MLQSLQNVGIRPHSMVKLCIFHSINLSCPFNCLGDDENITFTSTSWTVEYSVSGVWDKLALSGGITKPRNDHDDVRVWWPHFFCH